MKSKLYFLMVIGFLILWTNCKKEDQEFEPVLEIENKLTNSSFEESEAGISTLPSGWEDCGHPGLKTPPDLFENGMDNPFNVNAIATSGIKYVGMVVRDDESRECIYQVLEEPIDPDEYVIKVIAARSDRYTSLSPTTVQSVEFNRPAIIDIFGVDEDGNEDLLYRSDLIESTDWITIQYRFSTNKSYEKVKITSNYQQPVLFPYNGNVLIDEFELGPEL